MTPSDATELQTHTSLPADLCQRALQENRGDVEAALFALIDAGEVSSKQLNPDTASNAAFSRAARRERIENYRKLGGISKTQRELAAKHGIVLDEKSPEQQADEQEQNDEKRREELRKENPRVPANAGEWARIMARGERRRAVLAAHPKTLDCSPFPPLPMDQNGWEGKDVLSAWAGTQARQGGYTSLSSDEPSNGEVRLQVPRVGDMDDLNPRPPRPEIVAAYKHFKENAETIRDAVLSALLVNYTELRKSWVERDPELADELPVVESLDAMKHNVGLGNIHLLPIAKDGMAYLGLELGCTWDEEHGAGAMLHGSRVVEIGSGDTGFDTWAAIKDGGEELREKADWPGYITLEAFDRGMRHPPR